MNKTYFAHETACIDENVQIGHDTRIWHFSHIMPSTKIGTNCNIGQNVVVGPGVTIGANCKIQNNVSVYTGVTLEDGVFCGPSMVFTNVINPRAEIERKSEFKQTLVRRGASIGANATILCGHTIGRYALIGAGAVVVDDVADFALVVGNPSRQVGWVCRCAERLSEIDQVNLECSDCGAKYERVSGTDKIKEVI